jgi:hydroxyacylglutathione hydrolase
MQIMRIWPVNTGRITADLYVVKTGTVNFFICRSEKDIICFDSGFGKPIILRELSKLGIDPGEITHVFLTHSDFDHAGGAALFEYAKLYLSSDEESLLTGRRARMLGMIYNPKITRPHQLLNDNQVITIGAINIRSIATPGHTAGSMSYLVNESILFVGDAFKLINQRVCSLGFYINMDTERQKQSIRKLARLENVRLACTAYIGHSWDFAKDIGEWKLYKNGVIIFFSIIFSIRQRMGVSRMDRSVDKAWE